MTEIYDHPFHQIVIDALEMNENLFLKEPGLQLILPRVAPPFLFRSLSTRRKESEESLAALTEAALIKQFFIKVKAGEVYCPVSEIQNSFGQSPEERIGLVSGGYYRLFVAYWTLRAKFDSHRIENLNAYKHANVYVLDEILDRISSTLGKAFFPILGLPLMRKSKRREEIQYLLNTFAPDMTIPMLYEGAKSRKVKWPIFKG